MAKVVFIDSEMLYRMHRLKREMSEKKNNRWWIYPAAAILAACLLLMR